MRRRLELTQAAARFRRQGKPEGCTASTGSRRAGLWAIRVELRMERAEREGSQLVADLRAVLVDRLDQVLQHHHPPDIIGRPHPNGRQRRRPDNSCPTWVPVQEKKGARARIVADSEVSQRMKAPGCTSRGLSGASEPSGRIDLATTASNRAHPAHCCSSCLRTHLLVALVAGARQQEGREGARTR